MEIFINNDYTQKLLRTELVKYLKRYRSEKTRRNILISCLRSHGYLIEPETNDSGSDSDSEQELMTEIYEDESFDFNPFASRTFIDDPRLQKLQQRGKEYSEVDYDEIKEQLSMALEAISKDYPGINIDNSLNNALRMYLGIKKFYTTTKILKGEIKGSIRLGYIALILYYSLIGVRLNGICNKSSSIGITKEYLVTKFNNNVTLSDLPKAEKNLKIIFPELVKTCVQRGSREIETLLNELVSNFIFNDPPTPAEHAAAVYFIKKKENPETTYKQIAGSLSPETIRKSVLKIEKFKLR